MLTTLKWYVEGSVALHLPGTPTTRINISWEKVSTQTDRCNLSYVQVHIKLVATVKKITVNSKKKFRKTEYTIEHPNNTNDFIVIYMKLKYKN